MPKHETWNILLNNLESKHSLAKKIMDITTETFLSRNFMENVAWKSISKPFLILKESSVKRNVRSCAH